MPRGKTRIKFPSRKISETFLEFAEPLLEPLGPEATEHEVHQALQIAFTVWNAVVYEAVRGDTQFLEILKTLSGRRPEVAVMIDHLIERKRYKYSDDQRLVGHFQVTTKNGELNLRAEARDPTTSSD